MPTLWNSKSKSVKELHSIPTVYYIYNYYIHIYIHIMCVWVGGYVLYISYIYIHISLSLCASYILISAASSPIGFVFSRQRRKLHKRRLYKQLRSSNSIRRALFCGNLPGKCGKMWEKVGKCRKMWENERNQRGMY
jgi:hypothetical protein